jgi:hypothetical protein
MNHTFSEASDVPEMERSDPSGTARVGIPMCTENFIRVDEVMESPKLAE